MEETMEINYDNVKFAQYEGINYYIWTDNISEIFRTQIPPAKMINNIIKHKGLYMLCPLTKEGEIKYVYKDNKDLKILKKSSKLYKKLLLKIQDWEEEFKSMKDSIIFEYCGDISKLEEKMNQYLGCKDCKVKIKCKKGEIRIIKE
jgi:hypothetical protein